MLEDLLLGIVEFPQDEDRYLVLSDWLEEYDDPRRAELLRLHRRLLATCCEPDEHPERAAWQARIVELLAEGVRPCLPQRTLDLGEGVEMKFSFIPPGRFLMGSPEGEERRQNDEEQHRVTLTRAFWMGVHHVTEAQWFAVMGTRTEDSRGSEFPALKVRLDECSDFCRRLGGAARMPTEAEWEYACRAGTTTAYHAGDGPDAMTRAGWCNHDGTFGTGRKILPGYIGYGEGARPKPAGSFEPNAWGLYDMHGNAWEWCQDWYERGRTGEAVDPCGPATGRKRVLRGGSYHNDPGQCRAAMRARIEPDPLFRPPAGLRVCLDVESTG
jgi:sulfatase modifying factor 1